MRFRALSRLIVIPLVTIPWGWFTARQLQQQLSRYKELPHDQLITKLGEDTSGVGGTILYMTVGIAVGYFLVDALGAVVERVLRARFSDE